MRDNVEEMKVRILLTGKFIFSFNLFSSSINKIVTHKHMFIFVILHLSITLIDNFIKYLKFNKINFQLSTTN